MNLNCPMPIARYDTITLAHGGGGTLTAALIHEIFRPAFGATTSAPHDATAFQLANSRIAVTTDSYVVQPLFFPGGDIGSLAVNGSVNDLLMAGARPRILTAGFILEEGLPLATLQQVAESMRRAAETAGVRIIAGDTKVIERSRGDGLYINTSGVGEIIAEPPPAPERIQPCLLYTSHYEDARFLGRGTCTVSQIFYTSPSRCAVADSCAISARR